MICTLLTYFLVLIAAVPSSKFLNSDNKSFKVHCRANFLFSQRVVVRALPNFCQKIRGIHNHPEKMLPHMVEFFACFLPRPIHPIIGLCTLGQHGKMTRIDRPETAAGGLLVPCMVPSCLTTKYAQWLHLQKIRAGSDIPGVPCSWQRRYWHRQLMLAPPHATC